MELNIYLVELMTVFVDLGADNNISDSVDLYGNNPEDCLNVEKLENAMIGLVVLKYVPL